MTLKLLPVIPRYIQWTIPSLLYQIRSKNPAVHKVLLASVSAHSDTVPYCSYLTNVIERIVFSQSIFHIFQDNKYDVDLNFVKNIALVYETMG